MNAVVDIKINKKLEDGDILVYHDGSFINIPKNEYLKVICDKLAEHKNELENLASASCQDFKEINKLRLFNAKSIYDNYVERGVIEENEAFDNMWIEYIFNNGTLNEEAFPEEFTKILDMMRISYE